MAQIALDPLVLKDTILTIGTDTYEKHVESVTFEPTASTMSFVGLGGNTHTDTGIATWVCTLGYAQDWETANSLSQYLLANEGDAVAAVFKPRTGTGPTFTATLSITPGPVGGMVNAYSKGQVSLGSTKPVLVPAV